MEKQLAEVVDGTEIKEITETQNLCSCENDGANEMCTSENDDTRRDGCTFIPQKITGIFTVFIDRKIEQNRL